MWLVAGLLSVVQSKFGASRCFVQAMPEGSAYVSHNTTDYLNTVVVDVGLAGSVGCVA